MPSKKSNQTKKIKKFKWVNPIHAARAKYKKKYCGKYLTGTYGVNKKGCKKDELCVYSDQGSGGEWCFNKKRKYTKKIGETKKAKKEKNLKKWLQKLKKMGKKSRRKKSRRKKIRKISFKKWLQKLKKSRRKKSRRIRKIR